MPEFPSVAEIPKIVVVALKFGFCSFKKSLTLDSVAALLYPLFELLNLFHETFFVGFDAQRLFSAAPETSGPVEAEAKKVKNAVSTFCEIDDGGFIFV